jgi:hypothetical protein
MQQQQQQQHHHHEAHQPPPLTPPIAFRSKSTARTIPTATRPPLQAAQQVHAPEGSACGGVCACSTCPVHVKVGAALLSEMEDEENDILDKAFPDNPVGIVHVSMHGAVVNSKAMEKFGYKDGMPTPEGGVILRKADGKSLQGLVMETAYIPMVTALPGPTEETEVAAAKSGQRLYAAAGITTCRGVWAQPINVHDVAATASRVW